MTEQGIVMVGGGGVWRVRTAAGDVRDASIRGRLKQGESPKLAVGDEVTIESDSGGAWTITAIGPRRASLSRRAPGGGRGERILVANVDQVVVVFAAAKPEPHPRMLDRFLVIAEGNDLAARVVVNKVDLVGDATAKARFGIYEGIGYPVHYTSTVTGDGLPELQAALAGRISVLTGPSGVGKSSLLNTMFPGLNLRVGAISESVNKGRHTTVGASLHPLPGGGYVADTPGLREVGLWELAPARLADCFPEMRERADDCKFADCSHLIEPGCAVKAALDSGDIAPVRYESYGKLLEELRTAKVEPWE